MPFTKSTDVNNCFFAFHDILIDTYFHNIVHYALVTIV